MAKTYAWHQGSCGVAPLWAVPVPLLPDEIISSWLVRAALTQGCDPLVLTGEIWPKWRVWTVDADRAITEERLKRLSLCSGISPEAFQSAMLHSIAGCIHQDPLPEKAIWPWILAIGARNTKRRSGLQYCPICLLEDTKPYYRLHWRFAWHTGCAPHKCGLLDRCWNCNAPVELHRLMAENRFVSVCATCKADLRKAIAGPCPADALLFQAETDRVLHGSSGEYLGKPVSVKEWFEVCYFFVRLIRKADRSHTDCLMGFMRQMSVILPEEIPLTPGSGIELLRVHNRQQIFMALWRLLSVNRDQLEAAFSKSGGTRQGFSDKGESVPASLMELIGLLPNNPRVRCDRSRPRSSGPRSLYIVKRMMDRLNRRLEMVRR
jgi:hypothetical protein